MTYECQHEWVWVDRAQKDYMFFRNIESDIYVCRYCQFEDWRPLRSLSQASTHEWERAARLIRERRSRHNAG